MNFLRRGSKKSLVKSIHIVSEGNTENECETITQDGSNNLNCPEMNSDNICALRESFEKAQQEIKRLQTENEQLRGTRIAAEDQANYFENLLNERETEVLSLSTRIETLTLRNNELEANYCDQLYEAKTQYMKNLELELKKVKEDSAKQATHLQRKLKKLQEMHGKSKQEFALEIFALKDENNKLLEENEALLGRLRLPASQDLNVSNSSNDSRRIESECPQAQQRDHESQEETPSQLIVQLSQQVTALDIENQELKNELEKANRLLNRLRLRGGDHRISTKPSEKHIQQQLCVTMANLDLPQKPNSKVHVELLG